MSQTMQDARAEWARLSAAVSAHLAGHAEALERFRQVAGRLFESMARHRGQPDFMFARRPNVSLRLIAEGEPRAKLIAAPVWQARRAGEGRLDCNRVELELVEERIVETSAGAGKNRRRLFSAVLRPPAGEPGWDVRSFYHSSAEADVGRLATTIGAFLEDHRAVMARDHDHCCICGRGLTDALSRARGIGPECVKFAPYLATLDSNRGIIEPEETPAASRRRRRARLRSRGHPRCWRPPQRNNPPRRRKARRARRRR